MNCIRCLVLGAAFLLASEVCAAEPKAADKELLDKVAKKLLAVCGTRPAGFEWPPDFQVLNVPDINAYATVKDKDGKRFPQIRVFSGIIPIHEANIQLNLGVAYFAAGDEVNGFKYVERALEIGKHITRGQLKTDPAVEAVRNYTVAMVLAKHKSEKDIKVAQSMLMRFLKLTNTASIWWDAAYDQYAELSKRLGVPAEAKTALKPETEPIRPVLSHRLKSGAEVKLTDDTAEIMKKLGGGVQNSLIPGSNLKRVRYEKDGVDLLVNDSVAAICVVSAEAVPIELRGKGLGASVTLAMKVGMTADEVKNVLGDGERRYFTDPSVAYTYYRSQGIGVRQKGDKIAEIVLATIPGARR